MSWVACDWLLARSCLLTTAAAVQLTTHHSLHCFAAQPPAPCFSFLSPLFSPDIPTSWTPELLAVSFYFSCAPHQPRIRCPLHRPRQLCYSPLSFVCSLLYTRWLLFTTSPQRRVDIVDNIYFSLNTTDICVQTLYRNGDWVSGGQQLVCTGQCTLLPLHTLVTVCSCPSPHITPHLHCRCCPIVLHYLVTDTSNSVI